MRQRGLRFNLWNLQSYGQNNILQFPHLTGVESVFYFMCKGIKCSYDPISSGKLLIAGNRAIATCWQRYEGIISAHQKMLSTYGTFA